MREAAMAPVDVLVVGGGVVGCLAAVAAAEVGYSVAVIEKRAYLGREISAYNHSFVRYAGDDSAFRRCPAAFQRLFRIHGDGEILAPEGLTRQYLLAILEERGIPVLFEAEPAGVSVAEGRATGVLVGYPAGLAWVPGRAVLDATENGNLLRLLAGQSYLAAGAAVVHGVFELGWSTKASRPTEAELAAVEQAAGLVPGSLRLHPTLRNDLLTVEYAYRSECSGDRALARSQVEAATRQQSVAVALALRERVEGFAGAGMNHFAYECHVSQECPASPVSNVQALPALPWGFSLDDVAAAAEAIGAMVASLDLAQASTGGELVGCGAPTPLADLALTPTNDEALPVPFFVATRTEGLRPTTRLTGDVCVAGIGTGGGMAMVAAAEKGCRVIGLEVNRDLGGTHTTGGVVGYYAGYRGGASAAAQEEAKTLNPAGLVGSGPGGMSHAEFLRRKADSLGACVLTGTRVCGVTLRNGAVAELLAVNEDGLFAVAATVTVDATGDGDVAALAGAEYQIGDAHDGMVQSYSMWGRDVYPTPSFLAQRYLTDPGLFHPDVYSERLRAIAVAHRGNSPHHISPMLTPREGRRIAGDHALTMADILDQRGFADVVAVACTQTDSHAFASSVFDRLGGAGGGAPLQVRIPYGTFIPKGIEGLLVAAKAISGERDATCFCRMNADIKNAGFAMGRAAAAAVRAGCGVRQIDLSTLQAELKEIGVLPDWAFVPGTPVRPTQWLDSLAGGGFAALQPVLYLRRDEAVPQLETRFAELAESDADQPFVGLRNQLCLALAWHGSAMGGDWLATMLDRAVAAGRHVTLPHLRAFRMGVVHGGKGEDDYTLVNRLLVMAGRSGSTAVVGPLARLVADQPGLGEVVPLPMPYDRERKDIVAEPFYSRLRNVAFAVERQADPSLVPAMETLLRREGMTGYATPWGSRTSPRYMLAHLEIWLARAALRCGSRFGAEILIRYLDDTHVFFRRHARAELSLVAGADQGTAGAWQEWLAGAPGWPPVPLASAAQ